MRDDWDGEVGAWNQTRQQPLMSRGRRARSFADRLRGLLGTHSLPTGGGLLIEPCASIHSFGMRYPFDALFLDRHGRVVHLVERMRPNRVSRWVPSARCVLELPAGAIQASGTQRGDLVLLSGGPERRAAAGPGAARE